MRIDSYSQMIFTEQDLMNFYYRNPDLILKNTFTEEEIKFPYALFIENLPEIIRYLPINSSIQEFDQEQQSSWMMPDYYQDMDIAKWVLEQCTEDAELQRAGEELIMFQERDMFPLLRYLKYLVDTMRENNIVWGVGRGSSVSSFVLFLIGIHKINSLHYDLSIDEFLK